jgi:hypothetical protein
MTNAQFMKKDDIRDLLIKQYNHTADQLQDLKRNELMDLLNKVENQAVQILEGAEIESPVDTIVSVTPDITSEESEPAKAKDGIPSPLDPQWTKFILGQMEKNEIINGYPTCNGLRRMFELYIGEILECRIDIINSPTFNNKVATVKCGITYAPVAGTSRANCKHIEDATDAHDGNTIIPFNMYLTATATTIAESRCLRKGLRLNTISNEEMMGTKDATPTDQILRNIANKPAPAESTQKHAIAQVCSKNGLGTNKVLKHLFDKKAITSSVLDEINYADAIAIMCQLTNWDRGQEEPDNSLFDS